MPDAEKPALDPRFRGSPLVPGNPGNSGGKKGRSGRPPSATVAASRQAYAARIPILKRIADGKPIPHVRIRVQPDGSKKREEWQESACVGERIRAIQTLAENGGMQRLALTGGDGEPLSEAVGRELDGFISDLARVAAGGSAAPALGAALPGSPDGATPHVALHRSSESAPPD